MVRYIVSKCFLNSSKVAIVVAMNVSTCSAFGPWGFVLIWFVPPLVAEDNSFFGSLFCLPSNVASRFRRSFISLSFSDKFVLAFLLFSDVPLFRLEGFSQLFLG